MCGCSKECACDCQRTEAQGERPAACTPEQIRQCHGDVAEHPCDREPVEGR